MMFHAGQPQENQENNMISGKKLEEKWTSPFNSKKHLNILVFFSLYAMSCDVNNWMWIAHSCTFPMHQGAAHSSYWWQMCSRQSFVLKRQRDNYYCKSANKFKSVHLKLFEIRCTKSTPGKLTQYDRHLKKEDFHPSLRIWPGAWQTDFTGHVSPKKGGKGDR